MYERMVRVMIRKEGPLSEVSLRQARKPGKVVFFNFFSTLLLLLSDMNRSGLDGQCGKTGQEGYVGIFVYPMD